MKSFFALVTFDLHGVNKQKRGATYRELSTRLAKHKLRKSVFSPSKNCEIFLPSNTYVGRFPIGDKFSRSRQLRSYLIYKTKRALKKMDLEANVFVLVGKGWAWGKRRIQK